MDVFKAAGHHVACHREEPRGQHGLDNFWSADWIMMIMIRIIMIVSIMVTMIMIVSMILKNYEDNEHNHAKLNAFISFKKSGRWCHDTTWSNRFSKTEHLFPQIPSLFLFLLFVWFCLFVFVAECLMKEKKSNICSHKFQVYLVAFILHNLPSHFWASYSHLNFKLKRGRYYDDDMMMTQWQ